MTLTIGSLHQDSFGPNAFSEACFIGQAAWHTRQRVTLPTMPAGLFDDYPNGHAEEVPELQVLQVSVPPSLLWAASSSANTRLFASFLNWKHSGIGIVTLAKADEALVVALDLAGRTDLQALKTAGAEGRVAAALYTAHELDVCLNRPGIRGGRLV